MGIHVIRVPDIGEGIAETEIAEWLVAPGDLVAEDQPLAAVMTDKATVEIPSPVAGRVVSLAVEAGATLAVGAELIRLEVADEGNLGAQPERAQSPEPPVAAHDAPAEPAAAVDPAVASAKPPNPPARPVVPPSASPLAAPSVRALARERGIDLRQVAGSGPEGRVLRDDVLGFDPFALSGGPRRDTRVEEVKVTGLRRRISQRMDEATRVPHITIIEEVDATELETLRQRLNARATGKAEEVKLTLLPFVTKALVLAVTDQPAMNAHHDAAAGILRKFGGVHVGIAAQTPGGLVVPVLRHAEARGLRDTAREIARLAEAARDGRATREELTGSTITVTSLGALGALATTPILNLPEVAIIGINRMAMRPYWSGTAFVPRRMMNISCSFDHRVIDGWDAAVFVQRLKELLELPSLLFAEV
ncbi:2-oxo acid dehydrogenase subunit E2 [Frigidibacter albus]|uniref:Dihydrolipoamide acetyltransferase component of pyruvate dehydrogenase complex n=1 Tax=Frigidibacter albus TaxID=1465486 RepID=A0A6L8VJD1_9RHOB|nr:dihydrolipoamide acetyltransferase family protein [Frigidibacter albus]MZQ89280.1 2-oxo acid dehydrogenase subunit E2 [Frigidibacter albus]NBE31186.1 2-oxo acid dehydrogenase subunit E2 [Frigidibacter albus]GGH53364.1 dihydrolipoamide acetyltransferase component of pyruvate dehydrogenase complex [Frigidibacter albus]